MDIVETPLPPGALLSRHEGGGGYVDCFVASVPGRVSQGAFIEAFYTTPLFRLERLVLARLLARPSTDADVRRLAAGDADAFSAWTVEGRTAEQILLRDFRGSTCSWLMTAPDPDSPDATRLHFGSAIVPRAGADRPSAGFRALLPVHRCYARALLRAAARRLTRRARKGTGRAVPGDS
ncbi:MAG: hypothetical protein ACOY4K_12605 [Pseudomonadota bacterium]